MTKDEALKMELEASDAITYGIERDLEHDHELAVVERELASEAIIALRERLAKPEQELVVLNQFLSDVMTAADLVRHGKQCKALATRLRVEVMKLHTALRQALAQPEKEPVAQYSDIVSEGGLDPRNTAPPRDSWFKLTDAEVWDEWTRAVDESNSSNRVLAFRFARALEDKLKEKNT